MSVEQHNDPFEDRLSGALRETGGGFDTDRAALAAAGRVRGQRLRLRRRAAVMGGAAGLTLIGVGGALLLPSSASRDPQHSSVAAKPQPTRTTAPVSGDQLIRTLEHLLPKGKTSGQDARGTDESPTAAYANLVFDDGKGAGAVGVSLDRVEAGSDRARQTTTCPDKAFTAYEHCATSRLPDGSTLMLFKGYEYPDRRVDTKWWNAELVTPAGQHVSVSEWNAAAEKDAPVTRAEPPLTEAELKRLATAEAWRGYIDSIPQDSGKPTAGAIPPPAIVGARTTLLGLLPKGLHVVSKSADDTDFAYAVVDDGKGKSLVQVNVQADMRDVGDDLFGTGSEILANGTRLAVRQGPGEKGGEGVVMWTVDTMRSDGRRVVISALNSGTQHDAATRKTPALTVEQLREVALSPKWGR
ncbi:hypothetical protein [Streptomyces olivochromogenes]|uniref:hypothetical protein n=1 Tax=Streptomyces olivochromogenes TaxID=1963 RepID=UPI001F1BE9EC|nr:hypothetical protein [Streptomyces olivochromogenes]MCF3129365.1 hypothetical protein [Streptomyces olivochromogenes]